ncbi:hypothetical protein [Paenibacillus massiliensis]|uniref:hypothetical protein n=1 Tax=Paenibacillus massiliensis TaxID=225917 RepID=UPI00046FF80F|nr:hypothetical protein [Paenibacillus massiliensis]
MYKQLVISNDKAVERGITRQVLDPESRYYGGTIDPATGVAWVNHTTGTPTEMCYWGAALVNPDSAYYRDAELLKRLRLASEYVLRAQHEDGSISPGWTNYHSPPDTAFVVVGYAQLYQLLLQEEWEDMQPVTNNMRLFLERTIPVLLTGGCHTPNHRWVLCAALGFLYQLFGWKEAAQRAEQWLAEGMDITPDGEWTERSNGIYSAVSDIMLIHAARLLDRPELLEPVRLNLRMMVYLVHPSGEIVTDYSGRQDLGHMHNLAPYYLPYAILARIDRDPLFAGMAEWAGQSLTDPGVCSVNALVRLLLEPELQEAGGTREELNVADAKIDGQGMEDKAEIEGTEDKAGAEGTVATVQNGRALLPTQYDIVLNERFKRADYLEQMDAVGHHGHIYHSRLHTDFGAPVARFREGVTSVTVMTEVPSFFALRHGAVRLLAVQLASYFNPGYVPMQQLDRIAEGYCLVGQQKKGYYGPVSVELLPDTSHTSISPWYLLPHQSRQLTHEQTFKVEAKTQRTETGWILHVAACEPQEVMVQLSFVFGDEGHLSGGEIQQTEEGHYLWKDGTLRYSCGDDWMELRGGELGHLATTVREAKLPEQCKVVLVNLMTPFEKTVEIKLSPLLEAGLHKAP